jgi:hypothetical protein
MQLIKTEKHICEEMVMCSKCFVEVCESTNEFDGFYECPNCGKNDFNTDNLKTIEVKKEVITNYYEIN